MPSIDELPARSPAPCETMDLEREHRHRCQGFAARDPASDAPSPPAPERGRLDRGRYRALFTPGRSWPRAARRLLQSNTIHKHDLGPRNPACLEAVRLSSSSSPTMPIRISTGPPPVLPDDDSAEAEPRIHGSGAVLVARPSCELVAPASPRSDGSLRRLRPNPIGSDTSCRATRVDYDGSTVIELPDAPASHSNEFESSPPGTPLARGLPERAASRTPSRKGDAFRRTRGAFRRKTPLAGSALVHSLYPTCGGEDPRLFYLRALPRTDGASGASGTRPLFEQRIPTIRRGLTTRTR